MKYEIFKTCVGYTLVINRTGGTRNDYRFASKAELNRWLKLAGIRYGGAGMAEIIYLDDHRAGVHLYCPEMGQRKPEVQLEATLGHYGTHYYVDTPLELKGRGITEIVPVCCAPGCKKDVEGWRTYRVTRRAFEKLKAQYPIAMENLLD